MDLRYAEIERSIAQDRNLFSTVVSYSVTFAIFMNLNSFQSPIIGLTMSAIYFVINAIFLGDAFFKEENAFSKTLHGMLLLIMLLGFIGWLSLIIYNLDAIRVTLVLLIVTTLSSFINRRMRHGVALE